MWLETRKNGVTLSDYTVPLLQLSFRTARRVGSLFPVATVTRKLSKEEK